MRADMVTLHDLEAWPPLVSVSDASRALGIGVTTAYSLIQTGSFPVQVFRVGSRSKVRTADLVRFLAD